MISPEPAGAVFRRLADQLRERIRSGELAPGQRFPSEKDLVDGFGVSRDTVRKATAILRAEGWIVVRHGYPTRVREQGPQPQTVKVMRGSRLTIRPATLDDQELLGVGDGRAIAVLADPSGQGAQVRGRSDGVHLQLRSSIMGADESLILDSTDRLILTGPFLGIDRVSPT